jgi:hypothetical protein
MSRTSFYLTTAIVAAALSSPVVAQNLGIATSNKICTRSVRQGYIEAFHINAGRDLDKGSVGSSEERVGQGHSKMD